MDKKSRLLFKESKFSTGVMYLTDDAMLCDDRDIEAGRCTIKTREGRVEASVPSRERYTEGWVGYILLCAFLLRTFWYVLPPNYRSDPPDEKLNSALLRSRRTYPPRDSWNFCGLRWRKSTKARQIDRLLSRGEQETKSNDCFLISAPFGYAGTKSLLTTNQQTSSGWVLPGRSEQQGTPRRRFYSWAAVSRSRGRSAPCPRIWVICSQKILLQSDLAGERSQFAAENKTASERTFVRFFSTKHGSLRITVGRWLPKETPIRSAPRLGGIYLIPITRRGSP
ncbi:PREDICTED: LOW QUALITY PROTEIN: uncharacterized protein LOC107881344 [Prunus mume]|uniref:LOW QUALITY PROTEIN: uncharacterized protein LOC107881344 n=1 Tax=Prunus mume TaxID=102107 RepID=A0ABM1LSR5_PRUMU|nr:PREDICTED: LOW QUALITY PROTEIN: uncharacterized protein LOC107881344 [Prunus mume]